MFHDNDNGSDLAFPTSSLLVESEESGCDHFYKLTLLVVAIFHVGDRP